MIQRLFFLIPLFSLTLSLSHGLYSQVQFGNRILGDTTHRRVGKACSISEDGSRIVVGYPGYITWPVDLGFARVFNKIGGQWVQLGGDLISSSSGTSLFGEKVIISRDGSTVAIGTTRWHGTGGIPNTSKGIVSVFRWDRNTWTQLGNDFQGDTIASYLGNSISLSKSGDTMAIGIPGDKSRNRPDPGSVKVYSWNGALWTQVGLDISGENVNDLFGASVSLSVNGQKVAVGAPFNSGNGAFSGHVRIFELMGGVWTQVGQDIDGEHPGDQSGTSVSISSNGEVVAIGAVGNDDAFGGAGHVRVFQWNQTSWTQMGSDIDGWKSFSNSNPVAYGTFVGLSGDGTRVTTSGTYSPNQHAVVFEWNRAQWLRVGNPVFEQNFDSQVAISDNGNYVVWGGALSSKSGASSGEAVVLNYSGKLQSGRVGYDLNSNCILDSLEPGLPNTTVIFKKDSLKLQGVTVQNGYFDTYLDTGEYSIYLNPLSSPYHVVIPDTVSVVVDSNSVGLPFLPFVLKDSISCPYLSIDISAPRIRRCFPGTYSISYCNTGTVDAINPQVVLELDTNLTFQSSTIPLNTQFNNQLSFTLDTIKVGDCGDFQVMFNENCTSTLGEVHCSSVKIYPDSLCFSSMPNIEVNSSCKNDTIVFTVINHADDFHGSIPFIILEDTAIVDTGSLFILQGQQDSIVFPTYGSREMCQFVLSPQGDKYHSATIPLSCDNAGKSYGHIYHPDRPQEFMDFSCLPATGSFDPNDKQASPMGYGPLNKIGPNSLIQYTIRFQNTGTDTAFFINIYDTLSNKLDVSTLTLGTSSHSYDFQFIPPDDSGRQVIRFRFDPIFLPDSGTNQAASNGFVNFNVRLNASLQIGTTVENRAAIFFDYNDPIITNTITRTVFEPDTIICKNNTSIQHFSACDSFTWIDGKTYTRSTQSPTFILFGQAKNGCDSVLLLDLTILPSISSVDSQKACDSFTWIDGNTYLQNNDTATFLLKNANGCDSLVQLNLRINRVDNGITVLGSTLSASADSGAQYQWLDCKNGYVTTIPGETNKSFTPNQNGLYAVIIQQHGCADTSECIPITNVGISHSNFGPLFLVYPNPTTGQLNINLGLRHQDISVSVWNILGQKVSEKYIQNTNMITLDLPGIDGVYLLEVSTKDGKFAIVRVVKG